ncbi:hypothetical protein MCGFDL_MCGFDL_01355, partial [Dysosmobacter welbionis]
LVVIDGLQVLPGRVFQPIHNHRPGDGRGLKAKGRHHLSGVVVQALPHVQVRVSQILQFHLRVRGVVGLHTDQGGVVVHPQAVHLLGVHPLPKLVVEHRHLLSRPVVQHLAHKPVASGAGSVPADHIGHAVLRLFQDADSASWVPYPIPADDFSSCVFPGTELAPFPGELPHLLPPQHDLRLVEDAAAGGNKRLVRCGRVLLMKQIQVSAAVSGDAPPPPGQLLVVQMEGFGQFLLLRRPFKSRGRGPAVFLHLVPGKEDGQVAVLAPPLGFHRRVPPIFELVVSVGGGFDDNHGPRLVRHRLGQTRQRLPLVSRPEGELGQVEAPERGRSADTAAACRGALDGAPQARPAALVVGRLIKDQLVGVACLPHGFHRLRQILVVTQGHSEQVGGGLVFVCDDHAVGIEPGGRNSENDGLRQGGKPHLPGFEDDDPHRLSGVPLGFDRLVHPILRLIEPQRHQGSVLRADFQERLDILPHVQDVHKLPPPP